MTTYFTAYLIIHVYKEAKMVVDTVNVRQNTTNP